jgi:hypothetical protein
MAPSLALGKWLGDGLGVKIKKSFLPELVKN